MGEGSSYSSSAYTISGWIIEELGCLYSSCVDTIFEWILRGMGGGGDV